MLFLPSDSIVRYSAAQSSSKQLYHTFTLYHLARGAAMNSGAPKWKMYLGPCLLWSEEWDAGWDGLEMLPA